MPQAKTPQRHVHEHVPCPFCGLLCDDLRVAVENGRAQLLGPECPVAAAGFEQARQPGRERPEIAGEPVEPEAAYARAAELLSAARHPLVGGLGADVAGIRAALELAERLGATVEHMDAAATWRNLYVLQNGGWMTTTLAELKNRAEFVLLLGAAIPQRYPRLFERYIHPADSLFPERRRAREVLILGGPEAGPEQAGQAPPGGGRAEYLPCPLEGLGDVAAALRALLHGRPLQAEGVHGLSRAVLEDILARLRKAEYGVVIWAPGLFGAAHAELAVQAIAEFVRDLNETGRCSGLSLGGENGATTSYQVCTWQTGYPLRLSFRRGYPDYDPYHYTTPRMLDAGEADSLLWISAFDAGRLPPRTEHPRIVLGPAQMRLEPAPEVFIPVAMPGIDHAGALFRCDGVVSLPLRKLREARLPGVAEALHAIGAHLN